jgi:hypothetical protein
MYARWKKCGALNCKNNYDDNPNESYFYLPSNQVRRNKWLKKLNNPVLFTIDYRSLRNKFGVCGKHFETSQFQTSQRLKLNRNALPTIFDTADVKQGKTEPGVPEAIPVNGPNFIDKGVATDSDLQLIENHEILSNISQYGDYISTSLLPKETELSESDIDYDKAHLEPKSITQIWINEDENLNECPRLFGEFDGEFFNGCLPETQELPIEKPYFKSVKSYLLDSKSMTEVCRICFHAMTDEETIRLYGKMPEYETTRIKNMLKTVLPDLDMEIYPDAAVCIKCTELLVYSHQLKKRWLETEEKLRKIVAKKKGVINRNADLVIVAKAKNKRKTNDNADMMFFDYYAKVDKSKEKSAKTHKVKTDVMDLVEQNVAKVRNTNMVDHVKRMLLNDACVNTSKVKPAKPGKARSEVTNLIKQNVETVESISLDHSYVNRPKMPIPRRHKGKIEVSDFIVQNLAPKDETVAKEVSVLYEELPTKEVKKFKVDPQQPYMCGVCGISYKWLTLFRRHLEKHSHSELGEESTICELCGHLFPTAVDLRVHQKTLHRPYSCKQCKTVFQNKSQLEKHIRYLHSKYHNSSVQCHLCGKICTRRYFSNHMLVHKPKKYTCNICDKKFKLPSRLSTHMRGGCAVSIVVKRLSTSIRCGDTFSGTTRMRPSTCASFVTTGIGKRGI